MTDPADGRPRQLTTAIWLVVVGSAFLVMLAFERISGLNSVDTREEVTRVLTSDSGQGLGISLDEALAAMRVGLTVAAVSAAAAVVLGVFALRRHRGSRVALTVLAVPILVTAPFTGGLVGVLVAGAIAFLWSAQARDWFAGRPVRSAPAFGGRRRDREAGPGSRPAEPPPPSPEPARLAPSTEEPSSEPPRVSGFGTAPVATPVLDRPTAGPAAAYGPPGGAPASVRAACLLTIVFSGIVALLYAVMLVVLIVDSDFLVDEVVSTPAWQQAGLERDLLVPVLWLGCLMFLFWSAGAVLLAVFAWRRHNWARYLLIASAAGAIVAAFFALPFGIPHQVAAGLTIWGLLTASARQWYAGPRRPDGPPPPPGPPPPGPPPPGPPPPGGGKPPLW